MKWVKRLLVAMFLFVVLVAAALRFGLPYLNRYQTSGEVTLAGLRAEVTVIRDEKGMAYVHAQNLLDAIETQGFVTAQDRLFQMQVTRLLAQGRICELAGEAAKPVDVMYRTIGIHRLAKRHAAILEPATRAFFERYVDGVNAFIRNHPGDLHLEFKLAGIAAEPWTVADSLSVMYYMAWATSADVRHEMIAQMLVEKIGVQRAEEILPLNINPDDPSAGHGGSALHPGILADLGLEQDAAVNALALATPHRLGSNNWAASPKLSPGDRPILAGDPHLDARILPGVWYPLGMATPEIRAVGANIAGIPGMAIGRTDHIAFAMTNAYGDVQDLYVETLDPDNPENYLEGGVSKPFEVVTETLRIKDREAPGGFREEPIEIRFTGRGPLVSGVLKGLATNRTLSLRWAAAETMGPYIALKDLLGARTVEDVHRVVAEIKMLVLNYVFADTQGNIGWRVSGKLPLRARGDGAVPAVVADETDDWIGWIPSEEMPHVTNPQRGWVGTCNHNTVTNDYPYYYSSLFAPTYRYRRLVELMGIPGEKTVDDHWKFQRDTKNLMAQEVTPLMAAALLAHEDTREMGEILSRWDFGDDVDSPAPTIFQTTYRKFAELVFMDELGPELAAKMLGNWYFWQERLQQMVKDGDSEWFDIATTGGTRETRDELFHQAALKAAQDLGQEIGGPPRDWLWGNVHKIDFVNPLRRSGSGKSLVGGQTHAMGGSGETLYRGWYDFDNPAWVTVSATLRMVVDFNDPDKVLAVLPGGVAGRTFHPHFTDQVEPFMSGEKRYWWFSDRAIAEHAVSNLVLKPE